MRLQHAVLILKSVPFSIPNIADSDTTALRYYVM